MRRIVIVAALVAAAGCNDNSINAATGAAACATATGCGILPGGVQACSGGALKTNSPFTQTTLHVTPAIVNCLAQAGANCDAARRCLNGGNEPSACTGDSATCMGTVLTTCSAQTGTGGNKGTESFDCAQLGEMCVVNNGAADCGFGSCANRGATCMGTKVESCDNGILHEYDCAEFGATCVVGALGNAHCRGTGAACSGNAFDATGTPLRCDGTVLVRCFDSQEGKYDCAQLQEQCVAGFDNQAFACAVGNACSTTGTNVFSPTCAGTKLTFCNDGAISTFDCAAAGFHGCSPDNGGTCTP